jgi:hypothetical protein
MERITYVFLKASIWTSSFLILEQIEASWLGQMASHAINGL